MAQNFLSDIKLGDNIYIRLGDATNGDLQVLHDGTNSTISNQTGHLQIINHSDDKDIVFYSDDGSGNITEYFRVDGDATNVLFSRKAKFSDNVQAVFGDGADLKIYHDGSDSYIREYGAVGDLKITAEANAVEINKLSGDDTGNHMGRFVVGGAVELYNNGSKKFETTNTGINVTGDVIASGDVRVPDGEFLSAGNSNDLTITNTGVHALITNYTGNLTLQNLADDSDIIFKSDDGSGGSAEYFKLDGSHVRTTFAKDIKLEDNVKILAGTGEDLEIFHNGSNSYIENITGNFYIKNKTDDGDISLQSDDGSGGTAEYFRLDGGIVRTVFSKDTKHQDDVKAYFGDSYDLEIYHNGTHSYIDDTGTGKLILRGNTDVEIHKYTGEYMITATADGAVKLYYDDSKKLETASTGIKVSGDVMPSTDGGAKLGAGSGTNLRWAGIELSNGAGIQWTNGDARIIEGLVNNYSLSFQTYDSSTTTLSTALRLDGDNLATFAGDVTVTGDLIVNGTTTTINTATVEVEDNILQLNTTQGSPDTATAATSGISIYRGDGVTQASLIFDDGDDTWDLTNNLTIAGNVTLDNSGSGDRTLTISTTTGGDPTIVFNSDAANRSGLIRYQDNGTNIGRIEYVHNGDKLQFQAGSATGYALQLENSQATFAGNVVLNGDDKKAIFGAGADLEIYHSGSDSYIRDVGQGGLRITASQFTVLNAANDENMIAALQNAEVNLYFNNVNKFQTTSYGTNTSGRGTIVDTTNPGGDGSASGGGVLTVEGRRDGTANVLTLRARDESAPAAALPDGQGGIVRWQGFDGTDFAQMGAIAVVADGQAVANSDAPSKMIFYTTADGSETLTTALTIDRNQNSIFAAPIWISDYIYHTGDSNTYFGFSGDDAWKLNTGGSTAILAHDNGSTYLYHSGSQKFQTTSTGVTVTGGVVAAGNMSSFETTLTNNDDWQNSPISILERGNVGSGQTADKYSPNLNFHWGGIVSRSLWMDASGNLNYGEYSSTGSPGYSNGFIRAHEMHAGVFKDKDSTGFYLDPANTGTSLDVAGGATFGGNVTIGSTSTSAARSLTLQTNSEQNTVINLKESSANYGFSLNYDGLANDFIIKRHDNSSTGAAVLTLNRTDNNATFAGNVTLNSRLTFDYGGDHYFEAGTNSLSYKSSSGTSVMTLNASTQAATFAGDISLGDAKKIKLGAAPDFEIYHNNTTNVNHVSSLLDRQLSINANIIQLTNQANNSTYLLLNSTGATFAGTIASGNITVTGGSGGNGQVDITRTSGASIRLQSQSALAKFGTTTNHGMQFMTNDTGRWNIQADGDIVPVASTYDIGSSGGHKPANVYATNFHGDGSNLTNISATFNGGTVANATTFQSDVTISGSFSSPGDLLTLYNTNNGQGSGIRFSDQNSSAQKGYIKFYHADNTNSQGGGALFQVSSTEDDLVFAVGTADGTHGRITVWGGANNQEPDYGFAQDLDTGMLRTGANAMRFVTGGSRALDFDSSQNATFAGDILAEGGDITVKDTGTENAYFRAYATGTGAAGLYIDAVNGDAAGSDYFSLRQLDSKAIEFNARSGTGNTLFYSKGSLNLTQDGANSTFAGDIKLADNNKIKGTTYSAGFISFESDGETRISANDDVVIGYGETLNISNTGVSTFAGNVNIYTQAGSAEFNIGRNGAERLQIYQDDNNTTLTADNDSDENGSHEFRLNRTFEGTGNNNFVIQKDGTAQLTIDKNATATFAGDVIVTGDFQVNGTTTTVNATNLDLSDNIIGLNRGASSNSNDSGLIIERGSTGDNAAMIWDESVGYFSFGTTQKTPSATGAVANESDWSWKPIKAGGATLTSTTSPILILNPTANNYGGVQFNYGGATKGLAMYNSGFMVFGGEAGTDTRLQAGGQYAMHIDEANRNVHIGGTSDTSYKLAVNGTLYAAGNVTFAGQATANGIITANAHIYGRSENNASSKLYKFGGLFFTWDSDSYGTNDSHSLRSTYGDTFTDSITLNSYNHIRFNIDSNNNNGTSYFEVGDGTTGTGNIIMRLDQGGNLSQLTSVASSTFTASSKVTTAQIHNTSAVSILNGSAAQGLSVRHIFAAGTYNTTPGQGDVWATSDMRAPIFYDYDNTNYYLDPASTSLTNVMSANNFSVVAGNNNGIGFWGGTSGGSGSYAIYMSAHSGNNAGRVSGETTSDYNMYFKMSSGTNRGFNFKSGSTVHTGIDASGNIRTIGNVTHNGLTMTDGTDIDQIKEFSMTFQLAANTWTDTGIDGTDLATGTYAMQVLVDDYGVAGQHYNEYYSATISWLSTATNSTAVDEIIAHRAGHAPNAGDVQFRTQRASNTDSHDLMLQVKHNIAYNAALDGTSSKKMVFKFRRLI